MYLHHTVGYLSIVYPLSLLYSKISWCMYYGAIRVPIAVPWIHKYMYTVMLILESEIIPSKDESY